jgi:hypothetical protein
MRRGSDVNEVVHSDSVCFNGLKPVVTKSLEATPLCGTINEIQFLQRAEKYKKKA